jgi:hypothetical protein
MAKAPLGNFDSTAERMSGAENMTLREIREAYGEILAAYNEFFPVHPKTRGQTEAIEQLFDQGEDDPSVTTRKKMSAIFPKIKEAADKSGNPIVWHRGDPLDNLNPAMRKRIEKALKFGV